jgi:hypothetical protein
MATPQPARPTELDPRDSLRARLNISPKKSRPDGPVDGYGDDR